MKITSNEVSLKRLSLNFMSEHIENWNEFRREENLLLVKIGRWIYFLLCYFARATIKSWQRRRSGSTGMADVQENKAKIRDNEYVVTDARLLNLYARRLFKLFLMASHDLNHRHIIARPPRSTQISCHLWSWISKSISSSTLPPFTSLSLVFLDPLSRLNRY